MPDIPSAIDEAIRAGIDLALTEDNLRLSFEQRALQHQAALDLALEIERAGLRLRRRSAGDSRAAGCAARVTLEPSCRPSPITLGYGSPVLRVSPVKTTIEFSDELSAQIDRLRARDGVSMKSLIEEGIRLAIAAREAQADYRFVPVVVGAEDSSLDIDVNALVRAANADWPTTIPRTDDLVDAVDE